MHGRWEQIAENPKIIIDVAHNEDGILQVTRQLEVENYNRLHCIIGMVKDKEIARVLNLLPRDATYYFTKAHIPRALNEFELKKKAEEAGLTGDVFPSVKEALDVARHTATPEDLILVCGSVFLVGEVPVKL